MKSRLILLFAVIAAFFGCNGLSDQPHPLPVEIQSSGYFCTPEGSPFLTDLASIEKLPFEPFRTAISLGYGERACYYRVELTEARFSAPILFDTENSHYDRIIMWHVRSGKNVRHFETGDAMPFRLRDVSARTFVFQIATAESEKSTLYFAIDTTSSLTFTTSLFSPEDFIKRQFKETVLLSLFSGAILIMVLYNLVLYIILRDRTYLYYALSVFSNMILQIELVGIGFQILWPNSPEFHQISMSIQVAISALFGLLFARGFLRTKIRLPLIHKILTISAYLSATMIFLHPFLSIIPGSQIANVHAQAFVVIMMIAGVRGIFRKVREARFFAIAWFFLIAGILMFSLADVGLIPSNAFTRFSNLFGSVLEAVLLSIALADRIQAMRKEKEAAQLQALEAQRILNTELESRISERTFELTEALNHIQKDLGLARKIQLNLLPDLSTDPIHEFVEVYYAPADQVGGDIYDIIKKENSILRIMMADATGHGVQGALMSMALRSEYESLKAIIDEPGLLLERLNRRIARKFLHLTAIYPVLVCDINLEDGTLNYASAGHPPILYLENGKIIQLNRTGPITGFKPQIEYGTESIQLNENGHLLVFTDGIFEETNDQGEDFGIERMEQAILEWQKDEKISLIDHLFIEMCRFTGKESPSDDCTILHLRVPPLSQKSVNLT